MTTDTRAYDETTRRACIAHTRHLSTSTSAFRFADISGASYQAACAALLCLNLKIITVISGSGARGHAARETSIADYQLKEASFI